MLALQLRRTLEAFVETPRLPRASQSSSLQEVHARFLAVAWHQITRVLVISLIPVFLLNACATPTTSAPTPRSHYVSNKGRPAVLVFVHGLFGDAMTTWTNSRTAAYFPGLVADDSAFNVDVYVHEYSSPLTGTTFRINELAEDMRITLERDNLLKRSELIFVAHSMGGLLTRAFLLKNREIAQRVRFMYFFATPTTGSEVARLGRLLSSSPQVEQVVKTDTSLADLQRDWLAANFQIPTYCAYEVRPTFGAGIIVDPHSAMSLCNRHADPIEADHTDIVKPAGRSDKSYAVLLGAFQNTPALKPEGRAHQPSPDAPDVTLRFVYPGAPALLLLNQSGVVARDIKWTVMYRTLICQNASIRCRYPSGHLIGLDRTSRAALKARCLNPRYDRY